MVFTLSCTSGGMPLSMYMRRGQQAKPSHGRLWQENQKFYMGFQAGHFRTFPQVKATSTTHLGLIV